MFGVFVTHVGVWFRKREGGKICAMFLRYQQRQAKAPSNIRTCLVTPQRLFCQHHCSTRFDVSSVMAGTIRPAESTSCDPFACSMHTRRRTHRAPFATLLGQVTVGERSPWVGTATYRRRFPRERTNPTPRGPRLQLGCPSMWHFALMIVFLAPVAQRALCEDPLDSAATPWRATHIASISTQSKEAG